MKATHPRFSRKIFDSLAAVFLVASIAGCAGLSGRASTELYSDAAPELEGVYQLTVLHTNDQQGHFLPNRRGEYGMAARKTLIDSIRAEVAAAGGHTLVLDAGDINTGLPESDLLDAKPDFEGLNAIGYDAVTLGNHEFDNPLACKSRCAGPTCR